VKRKFDGERILDSSHILICTLKFDEGELYLNHFNWLWTKFPICPNTYFLITLSYDRNVLLYCNNYSCPIHQLGHWMRTDATNIAIHLPFIMEQWVRATFLP